MSGRVVSVIVPCRNERRYIERFCAGVLAQQLNAAGGRPDQSQEHPDGRRLPRTVGAEKAVDRPRWHVQIDVVDRDLVPEPLCQAQRYDR